MGPPSSPPVSVEVSSEGKGLFGGSYIFHAKISGKYASSDTIRWYANGEEIKGRCRPDDRHRPGILCCKRQL